MITIQELLYNRGLDKKSKRIKLFRHKTKTIDLYNLYRSDKAMFLRYQSQQSKEVFRNADYIVSFVGEKGTRSRFIGVFKIISMKKLRKKKVSVDNGLYQYEYVISEVKGYEDLKERVIIDWGKGAQSWYQYISNVKQVIEIQPGLHYKQFTDYFDFILNYKELKEIIQNSYIDWRRMLSITKGIYLINDTKTGKLYVGAAYGENGIWGRWSYYIKTNGHAENKILKKLITKDQEYAHNFQYSILMLLPSTITPNEAIKKELLFKRKLGTNSFGLNGN